MYFATILKKMNLGEKIKVLREKNNLVQEDLSLAIGKQRGWCSQIEKGKIKGLNMDYAIPLAKLLGVDPSYFYTNDPVTYPPENEKSDALVKVDEDPRMDFHRLAKDPLREKKTNKEIIHHLTVENRALLRENAYLKSLLLKHKIDPYNTDTQNDTE